MSAQPFPPLPAGAVILQVLPALNTGGVERGTLEMAAAIAKAGGVALVASAGGRLVAAVEAAGGHHITLPLTRKSPFAIWRNAALLAEIATSERVALIHARSRAPAWSAWLAGSRVASRFVTTYHGSYAENFPAKRAYNSVMARGERVIAISDFIAAQILDRYPIEPWRLRVIPRGVDPALFDPAALAGAEGLARQHQLAEAWGLPAGRPVILLPGRLSSWKGHAVAIAALARLPRPDPVLVFAGGDPRGRLARALRQKARRLGIEPRVIFAGDCADMPAAYALADVVINASTRPEAFGRTVIEAQAMARPVIAADHGGAIETIRPGETGWRVAPGDPAALADAIAASLALGPEARAAHGARARAAILERFTTAAMQTATLAVYAELLR